MNCLNAGLARLDQRVRVAVVAHDHRNPPRYVPTHERIEQTLKRRSLVRGENSKVHGLSGLSESCATATRRSVGPGSTP
jgi:RNA:NAD 2'-phosphotransferase (TPT1/KptA family)